MTLKACMFTNSPDRHFIIDLHPQYPQVSFAGGFSGHGYKFASVIGEVMADLAERQESRHNITLFNIARLTGQVSELYRNLPGIRVSANPARLTKRRSSSRRRIRPGARRIHTPRRILSPDRIQQSYYHDTDDPRYWAEEDVKPFW